MGFKNNGLGQMQSSQLDFFRRYVQNGMVEKTHCERKLVGGSSNFLADTNVDGEHYRTSVLAAQRCVGTTCTVCNPGNRILYPSTPQCRTRCEQAIV